jgi:hypothetical protein
VAKVVYLLYCKHKALSSNLRPSKKVKHVETKTIHENSIQEIRDPKESSTEGSIKITESENINFPNSSVYIPMIRK